MWPITTNAAGSLSNRPALKNAVLEAGQLLTRPTNNFQIYIGKFLIQKIAKYIKRWNF